jgi:hypothetical protein
MYRDKQCGIAPSSLLDIMQSLEAEAVVKARRRRRAAPRVSRRIVG